MFDWVAKPIVWTRSTRAVLFWGVTLAVGAAIYAYFAPLAVGETLSIIGEACGGEMARVSSRDFAFTLAVAIGALAGGLLAAHIICHVAILRAAIGVAQRRIEAAAPTAKAQDFARARETLRADMRAHPLLGHAWSEFDETLVENGEGLHNTIRPQAFFTLGALRERVSGLKWLNAEPGYFVGVGLLLTFIGLVIALQKAAAGAEAASAGQGAAAMQLALRELLQAATFKFATSIAGLAASIVLAVFYRAFTIGVETSLHAFCVAVESRLLYLPPQSVSVEMRDRLAEQLTELKAINSEKFFAQLGAEVAPRMQEALSNAVSPLADRIGDAVGQLNAQSQDGVQDLVKQFSQTLQHGAGAEMREITAALQAMLAAMQTMRADMGRSGDDFARGMTEAAENLNRLVADAGAQLGAQSQASRETIEQMLATLREMFQQATGRIDETLTNASEGAASKLTDAMAQALDRLDTQVKGVGAHFQGFNEQAATFVDETQAKVAEARERGVEAIAQVSARAAAALEQGLGEALKDIRGQVETFSSALRQSSASLEGQAKAIEAATLRSREAAEAFGRSAEAVRAAVDPVTRSNEKVAQMTGAVGASLQQAGAALDEGQKATKALADSLALQTQRLTTLWADYQQRFSQIDEKLGHAFTKLAEETSKQSLILATRTGEIDAGLAKAVDRLGSTIAEFREGAVDISEGIEELKTALARRSLAS